MADGEDNSAVAEKAMADGDEKYQSVRLRAPKRRSSLACPELAFILSGVYPEPAEGPKGREVRAFIARVVGSRQARTDFNLVYPNILVSCPLTRNP